MATGVSGYLPRFYQTNPYYPQYGGMYIQPHYVEEYDVAGNYSIIKIDYIEYTSSMYAQYVTWDIAATININGQAHTFTGQSVVTSEYTAARWPCSFVSDKIYHNNDGSQSITISLTYANCASDQVGAVWTDSGTLSTSTVALTTIPRLSVLSAGNGTLGTPMTLKVAQKSSAYYHNVLYRCGDVEEYIVIHSNQTSISWTPPVSLASQNTTGTSVSVELVIGTLLPDMTWIGNETLTIRCDIPDSVGLTVSDGWATVQPYNDGTPAAVVNAYVQGYSEAKVTFDASKISTANAYGAQIAGYHIVHNKTAYRAPFCTPVLTSAGSDGVSCAVYDTRGRYVSQTLPFTVEAYKQPTLSGISVFRCNSYGEASDEGTYISVTAKGDISSIGGLNTQAMQCEVGSLVSAPIQSGVTEILGGGGVSATSTYTVKLTLTDRLGNTATVTQLIPTADVMFHARAGGNGAAFGKYAEADDLLDVEWHTKIRKNLEVGDCLKLYSNTLGGNIDIKAGNGHENTWYIDGYNGTLRFATYREGDSAHQQVYITQDAELVANGVRINGMQLATNKVLWSGSLWMRAGQEILFLEKVSEQANGLVFIFSPYNDGTAVNADWNCFFVPKWLAVNENGTGVNFTMQIAPFESIGGKYIYLNDYGAWGYLNNDKAGDNNGVTFDNTKWVLRYVIGV